VAALASPGLSADVRCAVGAGAGWFAWGGQHPTVVPFAFGTAASGQIETGSLVAGDHTLGKVVVYSGRTSWLFMSLDDGRRSGKANFQVRNRRRARTFHPAPLTSAPGATSGQGVISEPSWMT